MIAEDTPEALRQRVSGDVLTLEARDPEGLRAELAARFCARGRASSTARSCSSASAATS